LLKSYPALPVNIAIYAEWRKQISSFENIGIAQASVFNLTGTGQPEQIRGAIVSSTIFPTLGVQPKLRRDYTEQEDQSGHRQVIPLADPLSRRRYHADPPPSAADSDRWQTVPGRRRSAAIFHFPREEKFGAHPGEISRSTSPRLMADLKLAGRFQYWTTARSALAYRPPGAG
jgi:hypothetical protein